MSSPPPSQNKTTVKTRTDARRGYGGRSLHLGYGQASNREACGNPSPKSLELREGRGGAKNRERREGEKRPGGQAGSVVLLPPSSSGAGGSRVGGGPGGGGQSGHGSGGREVASVCLSSRLPRQ